ncbi:transmembrane protein, putative [Bodo saltans]|uniref:Transmembrane protein, putative n=1 Tax=Bodo saltans TaxID=75058 RepID=A0A0S4KLU0_BODSA|nr:transmembrane protein, putative [Bodo saltans]|eukprot:CUI15578.1 transmembrane protein, putative [Bodo saltans]
MTANVDAGKNLINVVRGASLVVVGCYGLALAYRAGLLEHVLPKATYSTLVEKVEALKARTEPPSGSAQFVVARRHLLKTYMYTAAGFALAGAGIALFFKYPHFPIAPTIVATGVPAIALQVFPRKWIVPQGRTALFGLACLSCGYTLGPMNWIAFDSMVTIGTVIGCTIAGFSLPLFLTRGVVSYFFASQLLSCTLAISTVGISANKTIDMNLVLLAQFVGNVSLGYLHTVPTIKKCINWTGPLDALEEEELDEVLEALQICGNVSYGCWYAFRVICSVLLSRITRGDVSGASQAERSRLRTLARTTFGIDRWSSVLASVFFLVIYVRVVSHFQQRGDTTTKKFDHLRALFRKLSPMTALA